ncbi:non-ribosomal peptide synthetase [Micromonospora peucetia]|uniref:non-ribosomal peptide synthetase n=1 Tax=Micromonospora peucetia TaxID=47871 RepID=UPI003329761F
MIDELFRQIAPLHSARTAVRAWDGELTYHELHRRVDRLAHRLQQAGTAPGAVVGVHLPRSAAAVVGLLAILRSGAAYVALDDRYPPERRDAILRDAAVDLVLTTPPGLPDLPTGCRALTVPDALDDGPAAPFAVRAGPDHLAYLAYTSGSTGRPKGVCVPHRAVVRLVVGNGFLPVRDDDVFVQYAPLAFDASTLEVWGPLLNGACLVIPPPGDLSPEEICAYVAAQRVTVLWLTAGLFHRAVEAGLDNLRGLRHLLAGGDVLSVPHVNRAVAALPDTVLINGYGPTENTTFSTCHRMTSVVTGSTVPIGQPIHGSTAYVLDDRLGPVDDGQVGELYVGGTGIAHGYLGDPALTATRFVADPFAATPGSRMYRSGDLVRRTGEQLEFVGRRDRQVKIRGFRVEPAEVEAVAVGAPGVTDVAVVVQDDARGSRRLAAFFTGTASVLELRRRLSEVLPSYAVPARVTRLDALPLTANGKVDRTNLAGRESHSRPEVSADHRKPATELGLSITQLWEDLMGLDGLGADDDFFELGGHSLLGVQILAELRQAHGVEVSPLSFYLDPTPAGLARSVRAAHQMQEIR